ncbi:MAG: hypothetical protein ABIH87_03540 [bacterium]
MRRDIIKDVEIKEPPLEEITRKYTAFSVIKRSCVGGCGCFIIFIVIIVLLLKYALGVGPQQVSAIPSDFPAEIPIYDKEHIETITYVSGEYKNRVIEVSAIFPKLILTPLISVLEKDQMVEPGKDKLSIYKNMWNIVNSPVSDKRNIIKVEWKNLNADLKFLYSYYQSMLLRYDYVITPESDTDTQKGFSFKKQSIAGSFYTQTDQNNSGTNVANLIVNYYPQTNTSTPAY